MFQNRCSGLSRGHNEKTICDIIEYKIWWEQFYWNLSFNSVDFDQSHHLLHGTSCKMVLQHYEHSFESVHFVNENHDKKNCWLKLDEEKLCYINVFWKKYYSISKNSLFSSTKNEEKKYRLPQVLMLGFARCQEFKSPPIRWAHFLL